MANKRSAQGTVFKRTGTAIASVADVGGPSLTLDTIDVTAHDSAMQEFVTGLGDGGEVSLQLRFDPADAGHVGLRQDLEQRLRRQYAIEWPGGGTVTFSGYVTAFGPTAPVAGALEAACSIKVDGSPAWT